MTFGIGFLSCDRIEGAFERTWAKDKGTWTSSDGISTETREYMKDLENKIITAKQLLQKNVRDRRAYEGVLYYAQEEIDAELNPYRRNQMSRRRERMLEYDNLANYKEVVQLMERNLLDLEFPRNPHYGASKYDFYIPEWSSDEDLRKHRERNQSSDREFLGYISGIIIVMIASIIVAIRLIARYTRDKNKKKIKEKTERLERLKRAY
jgi:hypothetical protein